MNIQLLNAINYTLNLHFEEIEVYSDIIFDKMNWNSDTSYYIMTLLLFLYRLNGEKENSLNNILKGDTKRVTRHNNFARGC